LINDKKAVFRNVNERQTRIIAQSQIYFNQFI